MKYSDFTINIRAGDDGGYVVNVASPAGEGTSRFELPFDADEVIRLLAAMGQTVRSTERDVVVEAPPAKPPTEIGQQLFESLFTGHCRDLFQSSLGMVEADQVESGLRIKLQFDAGNPEVAKLASLPWELMYRPATGDYLNLSATTPLVRYLNVQRPPDSVPQSHVLRVLVVMASPEGEAPLDLDKEEELIRDSWAGHESVEVDFLKKATRKALREKVSDPNRPYHVLHFMGHGGFDQESGTGVLLLEDAQGQPAPLDGRTLGVVLDDTPTRLVVLNACNTARVTDDPGADPYAGVATALVQSGVTAVVAMQFPISDEAAVEFAGEFYPRLARRSPIDSAVSHGRKAIRIAQPTSLEWATPVLFMRSRDGILYDMVPKPIDAQELPDDPEPIDSQPPAPEPVPTPQEPAPTPGPPRSKPPWRKIALFGGVPVALIGLGFIVLSGPPVLSQVRVSPIQAAQTGTPTQASLQLLDKAGNRIVDSEVLAKYAVLWESEDPAVAKVSPDTSTPGVMTAQIIPLRPGSTRITATVEDSSDSRVITVELSDHTRVAADRGHDSVKAVLARPDVSDGEVLSAYHNLLDRFGFALEEDSAAAATTADSLTQAIEAFSRAEAEGGEDRPLNERVEAWEVYLNQFSPLREGPSVAEARERLQAIESLKATQVWIESLNTCTSSNQECSASVSQFAPGAQVYIHLQYRNDGYIRYRRNGEPIPNENFRAVERRSGYDKILYTARQAGCDTLTVENSGGTLLWRTTVSVGVGSTDACRPAEEGS